MTKVNNFQYALVTRTRISTGDSTEL